MKTRQRVTVGVLAAAFAGIGATAASAGADYSHPVQADELVPALASEQRNADRLPQDVDVAEQADLRPDSSRLIGERALASYWVARNDRGEICSVVRLAAEADGHPGDAGITSVSCSTVVEFVHYGASLRLEGGDGGVVAHLLPPDIDPSTVEDTFDRAGGLPANALSVAALSADPAGTDASPVLVSLSTTAADQVGPVEVPRESGEPLLLPSMSGR